VWRLMEQTMLRHVVDTRCPLVGRDDRPTERPTAFMMTTKLERMLVPTIGAQRRGFDLDQGRLETARLLLNLGVGVGWAVCPSKPFLSGDRG
jgi:hypothetical protein